MADRQTTAERLAELAQAVEASSAHGPWEWTGGYPQRITNGAATLIAEVYSNPDLPPVVTEYIAACDPETILALLSELSRLVGEHDTLRNTLREIAECAGWYAKNSDRIALEVDHALCVEVLSYAEDALAAVPDPQEPRKVWGGAEGDTE